MYVFWFFFFKQKTAYEMRISDWSSDVCSSDLYQSLILATKEPAYEKLIESYAAADKKNLPIFRKKMKEIKYDDKTLAHFREVAAKPVWDEWVARNKDKFDSQAQIGRAHV